MTRSRSSGFRFRPRSVGLFLALALMAAVSVPLAQAAPAPGSIDRVSVSVSGEQRNQLPTGSTTQCAATTQGKCTKRTISENGSRVVFTSRAPNIVANDTNNKADVFLAELAPGAAGAAPTVTSVKRISAPVGGGEGNGDSEGPSISPNGNWIAFESTATNLTGAVDPNGPIGDVFVYKVDSNQMFLASTTHNGAPPSLHSFSASVANNGTVAFTSMADNMTPEGNAGFQQIYARLDPAGTASTIELSLVGAAPGNGPSLEPSIDGSGTKVAFTTSAKDIAPDPDQFTDIVVRNLTDSTTTVITTGARAFSPSISPNGNQVAFAAEGVDDDGQMRKDVFVASTTGGSANKVSRCNCAAGQDRPAVSPSMSDSGKVAFQSAARFEADVRSEQIWLGTGTSRARVSEYADQTLVPPGSGDDADSIAEFASVSADGLWVSFTSDATNLVKGDFNGSDDVFVTQVASDGTPLHTIRVSKDPNGAEASGFAAIPSAPSAVSDDGLIVAFDSDSSNLLGPGGDNNGVSDIFIRDRRAGTTTRVSVHTSGAEANGASFKPVMSADGRYVAFESIATNLVDGDNNQVADVFLHDRENKTTMRVSMRDFGTGTRSEVPTPAQDPAISGNGQWLVFESAGQYTSTQAQALSVYRYNIASGAMDLLPKAKDATRGAGRPSYDATVADNGTVAFLSRARDLTEPAECPDGATNCPRNATDVFVAPVDGAVVKVSVNNEGATADGDSFDPAISRDGNRVAFASLATNLPTTAADANPDLDIYVRDLAAGQTRLASMVPNGIAQGASTMPSINADGSLIAFVSTADNLVGDDGNGLQDVFLSNPFNGGMLRVSVRPGVDGFQPDNRSFTPYVNGSGTIIAFKSHATNLVDGDTNGAFDTFVRDLAGALPTPCTSCPGGGGLPGPIGTGYRFVAADGGIFTFGQEFFGSMGATRLNRPIVGMAATPDNLGYWLVASDGGIFTFGNAGFHGSTGDIRLNSPIVGMASTRSGNGYWFVAADGGVFSFGDADFYGSMGGTPLNRPIVGMAATQSGNGYWLVASDGGIFSFGDADFHGSTGNIALNKPIVGMDRSTSGEGYRFVASDGGVFTFGDAKFHGSMGDTPLNKPIVGMARSRAGDGYWLVASDGGIFSFGSAAFYGSTGDIALNSPIVGMAS